MKHTVLLATLGLAAFGATAQEVGNVISSTPVIQQVAVPRTLCAPGVVALQPPTSGAGGLIGAIAGGVLGSTIGSGSGTGAAIVAGTALGAIVGNNVEANNQRAQQVATPTCTTETTYENRTVAWNVTYEYAGRQYTTQMPYDPGRSVQLQVTPVAQGAPAPAIGGGVSAPPLQSSGTVVVPAPIVVQPYATYPAYAYPAPAYAYPAYYPAYYRPWPVGISLGFVGTFGGHRHHHHRR